MTSQSVRPDNDDNRALYDVAVVGCGPVGAMAANLLAAEGLSVLIIDAESAVPPFPRAAHVDHEMMRLFQSVGLACKIAPEMAEGQGHLHIGADGGMIRYMGTAGKPKPYGWANDYFFFQPGLEARLREGMARHKNIELRLERVLIAFDEQADAVQLHFDAPGGRETARAKWVIACDGARGPTRKLLGIGLDDLDFDEPWLVIDAEVSGPVAFPPLSDVPFEADLQHLSVMMCDPRRPATVIPGLQRHRRWEFMLLPGEQEEDLRAPAKVAELLEPYLTDVPHRLLRATTYRFHGLIAESWRTGRVFLAGDAAHQTPPFFGQGMCHGMRDVANLSWKLGLVVHGLASAELLDSYEREREPHVRSVLNAAIEAGRYICELDPVRAGARDAALRQRARDGHSSAAADLIPAYRTGAIADDKAGAGERFIQPWIQGVNARQLLDDVTGSGWRLFVDGDLTIDVAAIAPLTVKVISIETLNDDGMLLRWLRAREVSAVLIRPDNYVFGTANGDVAALLLLAQQRLHLIVAERAV